MVKDRLDRNPSRVKVRFDGHDPVQAETSSIVTNADTVRPRVLVVGPGPAQVGGVTTFIQILMSSRIVAEKHELIHLDTTRAPGDVASAGRFSLRNLSYFLAQTFRLILVIIRRRPKVIHLAVTSGWSFWKESMFLLIGKGFRVRSVAHLHGGHFRDYYWKTPRSIRPLIGWVMKQADVVIALSGQWRRFLIEEVRSDIRVVVIPNTVDNSFAAATEQDNSRSRQNGDLVLFVGRLSQAKGVFDIIRAAPLVLSCCKETIFLLVGGVPEIPIRDEIQRCATEANLGDAVQFLGEITGQNKLDVFRRATVFVLPSYIEGLPYALLEAMAVGLPVIATSVGAIPEIVKEGHNGFLVQPGDYATLASRIVQLLQDEPLRQCMGLANRRVIQESYLPNSAMTRLVGVYNWLLGLGTEDLLLTREGHKEERNGIRLQ